MINKIKKPCKSKIPARPVAEVFPELYGREAYETWKAREVEIDRLMLASRLSVRNIVMLREENYRRMKAAGERRYALAAPAALPQNQARLAAA